MCFLWNFWKFYQICTEMITHRHKPNQRLLFKAQLPGLWKWYSNEDKNMKRKPRIKKCSATCEGLCIETMITKLWWLCQLLWWLIQINARIWHLQKIWKRGTSIREKEEWHKMIIDEGVIVQEPSHDRKKKTSSASTQIVTHLQDLEKTPQIHLSHLIV